MNKSTRQSSRLRNKQAIPKPDEPEEPKESETNDTPQNSVELSTVRTLINGEIRIRIIKDRLRESTINLYIRQLVKLFNDGLKKYEWSPEEFIARVQRPRQYSDANFESIFHEKNSDIISLLMSIYTAKESLILTLNALCKITNSEIINGVETFRYRSTFAYYNEIRKEISKQNKDDKLDNELTPEEMEKFIDYDDLMAVPDKAKQYLIDHFGKVFLTKEDIANLKRGKKADYLKTVFHYIILYVNVHYPIRLVWASVQLTPEDGKNYLKGNKLYLNDFKNVRLMGPQVLTMDKPTMTLINTYLNFLKTSLDQKPEKLLYRLYNGTPAPFNYSRDANGFSKVISSLFIKYNGKSISMNIIRHIVVSHIIQSPAYAKMTNRQKNDIHAKLLHSTQAANSSYNKIANRAIVADEPEEAPIPSPPVIVAAPPKRVERHRSRRERIFHGDFTPSGSDKSLEVEIFEK